MRDRIKRKEGLMMSWNIDRNSNEIEQLKKALAEADSVVVGAGAGLSTSAGFTYSGKRFDKYFGDFMSAYGFTDMYSGGFYPYRSPEQFWGFWCRYIYINRYQKTPKPTYEKLLKLLEGKDYEELISKPVDLVGTDDYILVYSLTTSMKIYEEASKLAEKYHCKMAILKRGAHPPLASTFKNAIDLIAVGPKEFLSLIKYAKCVVTGSYHALQFSLLFHTNFYIYLDDANAENSRMISTLAMFGLDKQLYFETSSLPKILPQVLFDAVEPIIKSKREESMKLLKQSIEDKLQEL